MKNKKHNKFFLIILGLLLTKGISAQSNFLKLITDNWCEYQNLISSEKYKQYGINRLKTLSFDIAAEDFRIACIKEKDSVKKADLFYYAAITEFARKNYPESRSLALKATEYNPKFCKSYILIAKLYAASANEECFLNKFEKQAVYWAAVDKLEKAKSVNISCCEEANTLTEKYKNRFPYYIPEIFSPYKDGKKYKVGCWINEETIMRFNHR